MIPNGIRDEDIGVKRKRRGRTNTQGIYECQKNRPENNGMYNTRRVKIRGTVKGKCSYKGMEIQRQENSRLEKEDESEVVRKYCIEIKERIRRGKRIIEMKRQGVRVGQERNKEILQKEEMEKTYNK